MSDSIRIAVIDDHPLLRDGVVRTLQRAGKFKVIGVGGSAADALGMATELSPDLMLLDISMPGNGVEAAHAIASKHPAIKIIILTVSEREEDVLAAMAAGAQGYVLKGVTGKELLTTIEAVSRGETYIAPQFAARLLVKMRRQEPPASAPPAQAHLTKREEQILEAISGGLTNKEIARRFEISDKTVKHHVTIVLQKLHARNRVEAALMHLKQTARIAR